MFFYGLYLALRSRAVIYFSSANPGMKYGGVMGESKMKVLEGIPKQYLPKTLFFRKGALLEEVMDGLNRYHLDLPLIVKPDRGERGKCVELVESPAALGQYLARIDEEFLVQEFISHPLELGILYYRYPESTTGYISSVVRKEFLKVQGDGRSSLGALLEAHPRAAGRLDYFRSKFADRWHQVPMKGSSILVEPIGNHARGTTFLSANDLISPELVRVFDQISQDIPGYYYGRFDLRVPTLEDLYAGRNIKILELNGVSSEPAHIYDPGNNLLQAYRDIARHMRIIYDIARANHRCGHPRASSKDFFNDLLSHFRHNRARSRMARTK